MEIIFVSRSSESETSKEGFHFDMNATRKLDMYFAEIKAKGIIIIDEPENEFWGERIFTAQDPDGYALMFSEHV